jgi:Lon protease-like protein
MTTERIPLFPLEAVLLPGAVLPLHIFEPRYRQMIRYCLDHACEFGVVLQAEQGIAEVGCTAAISQVLQQHDDGRMDILAVGRRVFQVHSILEEKAYREADVEFVDDVVSNQPTGALLADYQQLHEVLFDQPAPELEADDTESVAYAIANELPLDLEFKQNLLATRSETERQRLLHERVRSWIPAAEHKKRVKRAAGGNGHGLH